MEKKIGIPAGELLENIFRILCQINSYREIIFPERVSVIIADDSDAHRIRQGHMGYKSVMLVQFNSKIWAIGIGKAWGDYPAHPYNSDILAIELPELKGKADEKISERIQELINSGVCFQHSLIIARQNGQITVAKNPENRFGKKILESVRPIAAKFVAQPLEVSNEYVSAVNLLPMVKSPVLYKQELIEILAKQISEILSKE
jgi:hypothetical protein